MRIIFCNIAYLRYYDGRIAGELKPASGGRWVQENEDAHEKWNFLNMDGYCYGFVQGISDNIHIERIDKALNKQEHGENVTVVWCAKCPDENKTVIVGWYENATVYRYDQYLPITALTGIDRCYQFVTKAEDAYLIPEDKRTLEINRASQTGTGTGFGQMNYWFADSEHARLHVIPEVLEYIDNCRAYRINLLDLAFEDSHNEAPFTEDELEILGDGSVESSVEFLQLAYRRYAKEPSGDNAYCIGAVLSNLFQHEKAVVWLKKAVEYNSEDWEAKGLLMANCSQIEQYETSSKYALELLESSLDNTPDFRDIVYCTLADNYFNAGNVHEAIKWQDRILAESKNRELIEHTQYLKNEWENYR